MIVVLRARQLHQTINAVAAHSYKERYSQVKLNERLLRWLEHEARIVEGSTTLYRVTMPAVGWLRVQEALVERCFTVHGKRDHEAPLATRNALRLVQRAINLRERHPALTRGGALGTAADYLPVWRCAYTTQLDYHCYPVVGKFLVLEPHVEASAGGPITTWKPCASPPQHPLFEERNHWDLMT